VASAPLAVCYFVKNRCIRENLFNFLGNSGFGLRWQTIIQSRQVKNGAAMKRANFGINLDDTLKTVKICKSFAPSSTEKIITLFCLFSHFCGEKLSKFRAILDDERMHE